MSMEFHGRLFNFPKDIQSTQPMSPVGRSMLIKMTECVFLHHFAESYQAL